MIILQPMRITEKHYDFRKKLLQVHKKDIRDFSRKAEKNEFIISDGMRICVEKNASDVVMVAVKDFCDYMLTAMDVSLMIDQKGCFPEEGTIHVRIAPKNEDLGAGNGYMGSKITVDRSIVISAFDERGAAQALYYLEDLMTFRKAPFLEKGVNAKRAMYSPRMVHSGYGIDWFPDAHLSAIAHAGMDAILLFVKEVNITTTGFVDMNELIGRAAKYGIDVYAYSYMKGLKHPGEAGAEDYYDSTYGRLFENCPGFKGIILVGESCIFPSRDPNTTGSIAFDFDGMATEKVHPAFWPCSDYPEFLEMLQKVIYKHNRDADIVLWSYGWEYTPEKCRSKLIEKLPKDVSLLSTYAMGDCYEKEGIVEKASDYTLSIVGPLPRFTEEAKAAKRAGLKLYTMANTAGLTWDFGVIPYEPFPDQWQKRHDMLSKDREENGLCGLMESHHYGFYPSFISELAKWNFTIMDKKPEDILGKILESRFHNNTEVREALRLWSEGISFYIAVNCDQYGPFRIGPAYPLCFRNKAVPKAAAHAHFGVKILDTEYPVFVGNVPSRTSIPQLSVPFEKVQLEKMRALMEKGIGIMEGIADKNDALEELLDLGKFISCCVTTCINVKRFTLEKMQMYASKTAEETFGHIERLEEIAREEIENAKSAIPYVRKNSRLGWEPSMEYLGDEEHILWKISQVESMIEHELGGWKKGIGYNLQENYR